MILFKKKRAEASPSSSPERAGATAREAKRTAAAAPVAAEAAGIPALPAGAGRIPGAAASVVAGIPASNGAAVVVEASVPPAPVAAGPEQPAADAGAVPSSAAVAAPEQRDGTSPAAVSASPDRGGTPSAPSQAEGAWRALPIAGRFEFSYLDASGRPSLRRLDAVELKVGPGKLLLGGLDRDLEDYRGFRVDRIHALRPAESDEMVERNILDWLLDRAERQEKARRREAARAAKRQAVAA